MTNREIARRSGISLDAVKFHVANAIGKLGLADRRALRRWFAVPKRSALNCQEVNVNESLRLGSIGQISRSVRDVQQAQQWYANVLGLRHLYTFGKLAFFDCAGTRLYLQEQSEAGPESVIYFRVEDVQRAYRDLQDRGVEFVGAPHMIHRHEDGTEEWMAFFKDPEGRLLAIMSQVRSR